MDLIKYEVSKDKHAVITGYLGKTNMLEIIDIQREVGLMQVERIKSIRISDNWIIWPAGKMKNINRKYSDIKNINISNNHIFIPVGAISFSKLGSNLLHHLLYCDNSLYFEMSKPNWIMKSFLKQISFKVAKFSVSAREFNDLANSLFEVEFEKERIRKEKNRIKSEKARITREKNKMKKQEKMKKAEERKLKKKLDEEQLINNPNRYVNPNLTYDTLSKSSTFEGLEYLFYIKIIIGENSISTFRVMYELLGYLPAKTSTEAKQLIREKYYKRYGYPYEIVKIVKITKSNMFKYSHVRIGPTYRL